MAKQRNLGKYLEIVENKIYWEKQNYVDQEAVMSWGRHHNKWVQTAEVRGLFIKTMLM